MKQYGPRLIFKCEMLTNRFKELYARLGLPGNQIITSIHHILQQRKHVCLPVPQIVYHGNELHNKNE